MLMTRRTRLRGGWSFVLAALPLTGCSYNRFVTQEEAIKAQWAQVENQLQRRNDLIPNLVETVKGYAAARGRRLQGHRRRAIAAAGGAVAGRNDSGGESADVSALGRLLAVVENYPQLKANEQFNRLMDELVRHREPDRGRAHALQRARFRNTTPRAGSSRRTSPPRIFGFKEYPFFEAPPEAKQVPKVTFTQP